MTTNNDIAVKLDHVSKKFCPQLRRSMVYGLTDIGRNIFGMGTNSDKLRKGEFWAVNDVSLELRRGETLGLIGPNGSGKSTILKMLNGIYMPDKGRIEIKGKVGALIEVGAGFHPMLSGRDNIYINGAILGMSKKEIDKRFDSIVEFADIGDFLNAPVKSYSSGMYVRLGFAVAVHCEPDVLLIDEVLAVGDRAFTSKCYQKLNDMKQKKAMATVLVSHDLFLVEKFCDKAIFLNNGVVKKQGKIRETLQSYQSTINQLLLQQSKKDALVPKARTTEVKIVNAILVSEDGKEQRSFSYGDTVGVRIEYEAIQTIESPRFLIAIRRYDGELVAMFAPHLDGIETPDIRGKGIVDCRIPNLPILANTYYVNVQIDDKAGMGTYDWWDGSGRPELTLSILPNQISIVMGQWAGICHFESKWMINEKELEPKGQEIIYGEDDRDSPSPIF